MRPAPRGERRRYAGHRSSVGLATAPTATVVIVVDASAAVGALLHDGEARRYLSTERLAAPHLVDAEVLQTMRKLVARGAVGAEVADGAVRQWGQLGVRRLAVHWLTERIWALRHNLSAYDASYVALAEALNCPLLTADVRLAGAPGPSCPITLVPR